MDFLRSPEQIEQRRQWAELASTLEMSASLAFFGGLLGTVIAGAILLDGPRRVLAIASMMCFVMIGIGMTTQSFHSDPKAQPIALMGLLFMTLLSVVRWPSRLRWVNWPLLTGSGVAAALVVVAVLVRPSIHFY